MLCTGDQNIEHFEENINALPNIIFDVSAHTFIFGAVHSRLSKTSNIILDIGYGAKDDNLLASSLDKGKYILIFCSVAHGELKNYPNYLVFNDNQVTEFIHTLQKLITYADFIN